MFMEETCMQKSEIRSLDKEAKETIKNPKGKSRQQIEDLIDYLDGKLKRYSIVIAILGVWFAQSTFIIGGELYKHVAAFVVLIFVIILLFLTSTIDTRICKLQGIKYRMNTSK